MRQVVYVLICSVLFVTGCGGGSESTAARAPVEPEEGIISEYGYTVYKTQFDPEYMPDQVSITYKFSKPVEYRDSMIYPLEGDTEVRVTSDVPDSTVENFFINLYPIEEQGNVYANVVHMPEDFPVGLSLTANFGQIGDAISVQFTGALLLQLSGFLIVDPGPFDPGSVVVSLSNDENISIFDPTMRPLYE